MSKERSLDLILEDMLLNIRKASRYTEKMTLEDFKKSEITQDAVLRVIQIIGEAAYYATEEQKTRHTEIEWTKIARSRHILVHHYENIDLEIIWRIVKEHLPVLEKQIEAIKPSENPAY